MASLWLKGEARRLGKAVTGKEDKEVRQETKESKTTFRHVALPKTNDN
jgi:hypothetical protein